MPAALMDGRAIARQLRERLKKEISQAEVTPGLATILVGEDTASHLYVKLKLKACEEVGIKGSLHHFTDQTSQKDIIEKIEELNEDPDIHGILIQLPLPEHFDTYAVINAIHVKKDVDGLHSHTLGELLKGDEHFASCTPKAVLSMLEHYEVELEGREVVVIGASIEVGKPLAIMLLNRAATVSICHKKTQALEQYTQKADVVISCTGVPNILTPAMVKAGAVVIDVGISKVDGKIQGDVHKDVADKAAWITPVPGGVGPVTVAMLLQNTFLATQKRKALKMKHI